MLLHVNVGVTDIPRSKRFYDATFAAIGVGAGIETPKGYFYEHQGRSFAFGHPFDGKLPSAGNGGTVGFMADGTRAVDDWHAAGLANGGKDEGAPGPRPAAPGNAYGAYLRDPDGNKLCVYCQLG